MQLTITMQYVSEECCACGVIFCVSQQLHNQFKSKKQTFYCPNGHGQSYTKSTADELREQIEQRDRTITSLREIINRPKRKYEKKKK